MNSTEWEITVHLHDFDEFWMRYGTRSSNRLMVRMEPQQLSTKLEFLEYLEELRKITFEEDFNGDWRHHGTSMN